MKKISTEAYQALREALALVTWNKGAFKTFVYTALRDHTELLAGLDFEAPKRVVADALVDRLMVDERKWQPVTLDLMVEIAEMTTFPNLDRIKDKPDRELQISRAKAAVAELKALTKTFAAETAQREQQAAERQALKERAEANRHFSDEIDSLKDRFIDMQSMTDPHKRGYDFETLLNDLFRLFDMEPRLAYSLEREQIDGSLTYDTDDYICEARWRKEQVDRGQADIFATKVRRKGKNALGLMISIEGFAQTALDQYAEATPFLTMDGSDIFMVLDQRVPLDELLRAKLRHANETGSCHLPAVRLLN